MRVALVAAINAQLVLTGAGLEQRPVPDPMPPGAATEIFDDWAMVCGLAAGGANERICEVTTTITASGQPVPVARIAFIRQRNGKPMRVLAVVPGAVSIAPGVTLAGIAGYPSINLIYKFCVPNMCTAEGVLGEEDGMTVVAFALYGTEHSV
jgi:invasion protein IalB